MQASENRLSNVQGAEKLRNLGWSRDDIAGELGVVSRTVQDYFDELDAKDTKRIRQARRRQAQH